MRILLVHDFGRLVGGAEVQVLRDIRALEARGHIVQVLVGNDGSEDVAFGDYFFRRPGDDIPKVCMLWNPVARRALTHAVSDFRPEVVHFHTITDASAAVLGVKVAGVRVATLHDYAVLCPHVRVSERREYFCGIGDFPCCRSHAGLRFYFEKLRASSHLRAMAGLNAVLTPSSFVGDLAAECGLGNVVVVPASVPEVSSECHVHGASSVVAYVGRLEPEKGVAELIDEFSSALARLPDIQLVIAGTGSCESLIRDQIQRIGCGRSVRLLGHVDQDAVDLLFSRASVAVVPSLWPEPFGLVGPEAMAFGTPVVGSGRGGIADWLTDGMNGVRADPRERGAIASALVQLLTDGEFHRRCSEGAKVTAARFTAERRAELLESLYNRLVERSGQPPNQ